MSAQVQGTLLDVLKKKMRQTKEEMEKYKDECEEYQRRLQVEVIRREEGSETAIMLLSVSSSCRGAYRPTESFPSTPFVRDLSLFLCLSFCVLVSPRRNLVMIS